MSKHKHVDREPGGTPPNPEWNAIYNFLFRWNPMRFTVAQIDNGVVVDGHHLGHTRVRHILTKMWGRGLVSKTAGVRPTTWAA